jgi:hypothetical protein
MFRKIYKSIKTFLTPPQINSNFPSIDYDYTPVPVLANAILEAFGPTKAESEARHRRTIEKLEHANLKQSADTANKNLIVQHRLMIATLITALIALFSSISAIIISINQKPPVINVSPSQSKVEVHVPPPVSKNVKPQHNTKDSTPSTMSPHN